MQARTVAKQANSKSISVVRLEHKKKAQWKCGYSFVLLLTCNANWVSGMKQPLQALFSHKKQQLNHCLTEAGRLKPEVQLGKLYIQLEIHRKRQYIYVYIYLYCTLWFRRISNTERFSGCRCHGEKVTRSSKKVILLGILKVQPWSVKKDSPRKTAESTDEIRTI